ncbi:MAG: hypothetical protein LAO51_03745 [Acidobacteriia bacterium]|nr:hypothetical protein [Terriglobia bacterium]
MEVFGSRVCLLCAVLFVIGASSRAQDVAKIADSPPAGVVSPVALEKFSKFDERTRLLVDSELGTYAGLGYKLPHTAFGTSIEHPFSLRLEAQGAIEFSADRKLSTNDGHSVVTSGKAIFWANRYFGITAGASYSRLWTSQFDKAAWHPAPGVVFRLRFLGSPTRMYLDYVVPTGSIDKHGIESSRLQGLEYFVESRVASVGPMTMRFGLKWDVYHLLEQGNPQCDGSLGGLVTCRRKSDTTGAAALTLRFEWLKNASNILY